MTTFTVPTIFTAVDRFSPTMARMERQARSFSGRMQNISQKAANVAQKSALVGAATLAPLVLATKTAIDFEDRMADVAKTTGLSGGALELFGKGLRDFSKTTRTPLEDLQKIAEIGGQLGIDNKELLSFTKAMDAFNVALGKDFAGGVEEAASQVGKIQGLFARTRGLQAGEAITRVGSAINELGARGAGTSANITEFTLRLGALPDALKPSLSNTLALGTFLEELGLRAEIASGGMTNFLLTAGEQINAFASQMKVSAGEAKALLSQDPLEFAKRFTKTLKTLKPEQLAQKLHSLKIGTQETIKVLGAMASGNERLTELQRISNAELEKGTSLAIENAKKQETMAAKIGKLKNQITDFGIEAGNVLIPVLGNLINSLNPIIKSFGEWVKNSPKEFALIVKLTLAFSVLSFVLSGVATAVSLLTKAMAFLAANPMVILMIAIAGIIALMIKMMGNWEMIKKSFLDQGIIGGIKAIGVAIYDFVLQPVQELLTTLAKIPGLGGLQGVADDLAKYRASLGLTSGIDFRFIPEFNKPFLSPGEGVMKKGIEGNSAISATKSILPFDIQKAISGNKVSQINPDVEKQKAITNTILEKQTQNVNMTIDNNTGYKANILSDGSIPINLNQSLKLR